VKCEMIRCPGRQRKGNYHSRNEAAVYVIEGEGDDCYTAHICQPCADILELKENDRMPVPFEVDRLYDEAQRNARKKQSTRR